MATVRRSSSFTEELRALSVPTLLIWGRREPLGSDKVARAVTDLMPHGRLELLPDGHAPWLGQPERIAARVTEFVRGRELPAGD